MLIARQVARSSRSDGRSAGRPPSSSRAASSSVDPSPSVRRARGARRTHEAGAVVPRGAPAIPATRAAATSRRPRGRSEHEPLAVGSPRAYRRAPRSDLVMRQAPVEAVRRRDVTSQRRARTARAAARRRAGPLRLRLLPTRRDALIQPRADVAWSTRLPRQMRMTLAARGTRARDGSRRERRRRTSAGCARRPPSGYAARAISAAIVLRSTADDDPGSARDCAGRGSRRVIAAVAGSGSVTGVCRR